MRAHRRWHLAAVAAVALLVHAQAFLAPFQFDDWDAILESEGVTGGQTFPAFLRGMLTDPLLFLQRPLTVLTYRIDWVLWASAPDAPLDVDADAVVRGPPAFGFHVTQVLLTVLCAALAWALGTFLGAPPLACMAGALAVCVHPLSAASACYLSGRSTLGVEIGMLLALCGAVAPGGAWRVGSRIALGCAIAALSKPDGLVSIPVALLARAWARPDTTWLGRPARSVAIVVLLCVALGGGFAWDREARQYDRETLVRQMRPRPAVAARYASWLFLPTGLTVDSGYPPAELARPFPTFAALALVALGLAAHRAAREGMMLVALAWAPALLLPLLDPGFPYRAAAGLPALAWFVARSGSCARRAVLLALLPWAAWCVSHEATWSDGRRLWVAAIVCNPHQARAHNNAAWHEQRLGERHLAQLRRSSERGYALSRDGWFPDARHRATAASYLGNLCAEAGRVEEAAGRREAARAWYEAAARYFEESLSYNGNQPHVVRSLEQIRRMLRE
ncbi:MAG: hypothetical protein HY608_02665 [Planctomycetes bacterium]|nr:hypothetical protein [Planctomycetota bacterium]